MSSAQGPMQEISAKNGNYSFSLEECQRVQGKNIKSNEDEDFGIEIICSKSFRNLVNLMSKTGVNGKNFQTKME